MSPQGAQDALSRLTVTRPVAIFMVVVALVVFGFFSLQQLPLNLMPELTYPTVTVRTEYPGAAPEEVENDVSRPVEEALGIIGGLVKISSVSRAGLSDVILEFAWDTDMDEAKQDVLERLDLVFLPEETRRPLILHFDPSLDPIMELSLSGTGDRFEGETGLRRLRRLADLQVKDALSRIKGVAAVRVKGGLEEEIHVRLDEEQLRRTGLDIQTVIDRLAQENINVAGGTIEEGRTEYMVRTLNEYQDLDQIRETVVIRIGDRGVRVADLGTVLRSHREREIVTRTNGGESVQLEIYKEADANIVALAHRVKETVGEPGEEETPEPEAETEDDDPDTDTAVAGAPGTDGRGLAGRLWDEEGARLLVVADRSLFIEKSVSEVARTAVIGGGLAILVLFVFLRQVKSTMIIAMAIPISILVAFAPLKMLGVSLNIMSLGGIALGIGMLVDSSIVVLESIARCREEGDTVVRAAFRGIQEVRAAVMASTLTTIAVFLPMVFVEGIAGQAFGDLGFAVTISLMASTLVALFFVPMLASRQGLDLGGQKGRLGSLLRFASPGGLAGYGRWVASTFRRLSLNPLTWARAAGGLALAPLALLRFGIHLVLEVVGKLALLGVVALSFLALVGARAGVALLVVVTWLPAKATNLAMSGLGRTYPALLRGALAAPALVLVVVALCLWGSWRIAVALDSELLPEVHQGEFTVEASLPVGTPLDETAAVLTPVEQALLAEKADMSALIVTLGYDSRNAESSEEGEHTARFKVLLDRATDVAAQEEAAVKRVRGLFTGIPGVTARVVRPVLFSTKTPIEVEVHGEDLRLLREYGEQVREAMATIPELADVESTLRPGAPELQILYDRDRLSRYGLNIQQVAQLVRSKVQGREATRFNMKDRRIPIMVRLVEEDRQTVDQVEDLIVNPGGTRPIPLATVADVVLGEGPSEVRRVDGERVALIRASIAEGSLSSATEAIHAALRKIDWPVGMTYLLAGQNEEWDRSRSSLWLALGLSVFLVYVIMASQFESLVHPLVIMFTIPLAFVGTLLTLKVLGIPLSVVVILGMIMLAGIVVNNAIVLVDYINRLRRRGVPRDEAIVAAGTVRLRPILMTALTTILGLLPLAVALGEGTEIRAPMAIAVISGLISSTLLTLIVIPAMYKLFDGLVSRLVRSRAGSADPSAASAGTTPETVTP